MGDTVDPPPPPAPHRTTVHQMLGGGSVADVLLWRRWGRSVKLLVFSTTSWYLFERAGYNLMTFVANVLFSLVVILFLWAKSAALLNRPLPPIPDMEITEENVDKIVLLTQGYVNKVLAIGCDIAVERKLKVFLKVSFVSWIVSYVGSLCSFLTFVYIGVLLSLSIPVLYDRFQHQIDEKLLEARRIRDAQLRNLLKKIPVPSKKDKKVQ
ncbi:Reticulon-like protein B11 [Linum perenne]